MAPCPTATTCPYCGVGCGVLATPAGVRGDPTHPANAGRLCSKGTALAETLDMEGRLLFPEIGGQRVDWDTALSAVAKGLSRTIAEHGPDSVAFYVSGQLLTEDYYVANKLMKGFIGSGNIDTNSRLCMASTVAAQRRAFGEDAVPGNYEDLDTAELVVMVGSNAAWCHPVLHQRLIRAKKNHGARWVVIDPRRTATVDGADLHLKLRPGTDVLLFNGLLVHLARCGMVDPIFLADHTRGFTEALETAVLDAPDLETVARGCDLTVAEVATFYRWFVETAATVTLWSQGANQSSSGTDKVNAIINCHLATGRIGRPGMGPLSLTGQPNAMGGREVGGLANQLAAHMGFESPAQVGRVERFWQAPRMARAPGLKAVDMFRAVADGRIKAIWIMATNPAASLPDAGAVTAALRSCPLVIVSDCVADTDTARLAHIRLPAAAWGEKDGTVTNSDRTISRQRPFLPLPGEARPDWWIMARVAARMGWADAFTWGGPAAIFREHAGLTAFENEGERALDLSGLARLSDDGYDALAPVQWPVHAPGRGTPRLFTDGRFSHPDGRARLIPVSQQAPRQCCDDARPFVLNSGRSRDQWHTMTRTGKAPRLWAHSPDPAVAVHPDDAAALDLAENGFAELDTAHGRIRARVVTTTDQRRGEVFLPMHWNRCFAADGGVALLAGPATDPFSGQPELKHTPVRLRPWVPAWTGFALSRTRPVPAPGGWWSLRGVEGGWLLALAADDLSWPDTVLPRPVEDTIEVVDRARGTRRWAQVVGERLEASLFIGPANPTSPGGWLLEKFAKGGLTPADRAWLLSGRSPCAGAEPGRMVCACFQVGENRLRAAAPTCASVDDLTRQTGAGGNCGSCLPELKEILAHVREPHPLPAA